MKRLFGKTKANSQVDPAHVLDQKSSKKTASSNASMITGEPAKRFGSVQFSKISLAAVALIGGIYGGYFIYTSMANTSIPAASVLCAGPTCSGKLPAPSMSGESPVAVSTASSINTVSSGGVVNLACGANFGSVTLSVSGSAGNPTVYQTDPSCGTNRAQFTNITVSGNWITVYNVKVNAVGQGVRVSNGMSNVTFQGSEVSGGTGFYVGTLINNGGTNFTLDSTEIHGSSDSGMFLHHNNSTIQFSKFYSNGGGVAYGYHHIYMKSQGSTFRNNDFGALNLGTNPSHAGQAISVRFANQDIYSNYFHDIRAPMNFFQESAARGTLRIYNNRYQDTNHIMYTDVNSSKYTGTVAVDIVFANNTIQGSGNILFNMSRNTGTANIKNNLSIGSWPTIATGPNIQSNNLWNTATGVGAAPSYILAAGSNAIDAGTTSVTGLVYSTTCNTVPMSYCGTAPDIGYNEFRSSSTPPPLPDTIPPVVTVSTPISGTTVSGSSVAVSASASDAGGVAGVQFKVDGVNMGAEDTSSPYSAAWNSTLLANGNHVITAVARDSTGNTTTSTAVNVTVSNQPISDTTAPTAAWEIPAAGATISGLLDESAANCRVAASDASGISKVEFFLDNMLINTELNAPYSCVLDTTSHSNGTHTLKAIAYDKAVPSNPSLPTTRSVIFANDTPPTATITTPAANSTISGNAYNTATTATDDKGISKVEFYLDNILKLTQTETVVPLPVNKTYNYAFDTFQFANSSQHTFKVVVYDNGGNSKESSAIFTVNNLDTTAPNAPANLRLSGTASANSVPLAWNASTDNVAVVKYNILRGGVVIGTSTSLTYTDITAVASTTYTYQVQAVDAAGNTSLSSEPPLSVVLPAAPETTPPSTPTSLSATVVSSSTQINLSWTVSSDTGGSGLVGYNVYRGTSPTSITNKVNINLVTPAAAGCSATTTCSFGDSTGLTPNTTYYYAVAAVDGAGNSSDKTAAVSATTLPDAIAPTLTIFSPNAGNISGRVTISAKAIDNITVTRMEIYIDGTLYAFSGSGSINYSWNTNPSRWQGTHAILIKAKDSSFNTTEKVVNVKVH